MKIILFSIIMFVSSVAISGEVSRPLPTSQWNDEVKLWVARSCAGEAGFDAVEECVGIAWVYATRWSKSKSIPFVQVVRKYSAAIKHRSTHTRRWILNLRLDSKRPVGWPHDLKWSVHKPLWEKILSALDKWAAGYMPNPVLGADHFGGSMDHPGERWVRIHPSEGREFRNRFYRSPSAPPVEFY
jgi:hypothetical protein